MKPFARFLVQERWKILFAAQGLAMCGIYYHRLNQPPPVPLAQQFPVRRAGAQEQEEP